MQRTPFGRYRLAELLGRGGMGEVWRAFDTDTRRTVAVKLLPSSVADDPVFEARFRREAEAAAGLNDPHIVPIHHFGEIDGRLYVDMRLIEGRDLDTVLADGAVQPERAVKIVEQVASALQAAHRIGLVHRDVKPSNILLTEDDFAYLIDFGIARTADDKPLTSTGMVIGTWVYMAPERFTTGLTDPRGDVYALACVLYQCLTGLQPFPGNSLEQQFAGHTSTPPPRPSTDNPAVTAAFDDVIAKGMAKDPEDRYRTTVEFARAAHDACTPATSSAATKHPARPTDSSSVPERRPTVVDRNPSRRNRPPERTAINRGSSTTIAMPDQRPTVATPAVRPPRWWRRKAVAIPAVVAVTMAVIAVPIIVFSTREHGARGSAASAYGSQITLPLNGISFPAAVAVDGSQSVYVTDLDTGRVAKLASGSATPTDLPFTALKFPSGVAVDATGSIYVTDSGNNQVVKLTSEVAPDTTLNFHGLNNPSGVAVDVNGSVYVADTGNDRVVMLTGGGTQVLLPFVGLKNPQGVAVDSTGAVFVADYGNDRVVKLSGAGPQTVLPFGDLTSPSSVAIDTADNVYVSEIDSAGGHPDHNQVVKLPADRSAPSVLPFTGLVNPMSVAVDRSGSVFVADSSDESRLRRVLKLPVA